MFIYINTAIGALAGNPNPSAFPQTFAIDYVRVTPLATTPTLPIAPVTGGQLVGTVQNPPALVDVTTEGTSNWTLWSVTGNHDIEQKQSATDQIGSIAIVGSDAGRQSGGGGTAFHWSDGTTQPQGTSDQKGVVVCGDGNGFSLTVPADTTSRTLRFYVNVWHGQGLLQTSLSDGSAVAYNDNTLTDNQIGHAGVFTVTYKAASAGQQLNIHWTSVGSGCIVAQAATLAKLTVDATPTATPGVTPTATVTVPTATPSPTPLLQPRPIPQPKGSSPVLIIPINNALPIKGCVTWHIHTLGFAETLTICKADS